MSFPAWWSEGRNLKKNKTSLFSGGGKDRLSNAAYVLTQSCNTYCIGCWPKVTESMWSRSHTRARNLHLHPSLPPSFCVCHHQRITQRDTLHHWCKKKKNVAWKSSTGSKKHNHLFPSVFSALLNAPTLLFFPPPQSSFCLSTLCPPLG